MGIGIKIDIIPYFATLKDVLLLADTKVPPDQSSEENADIFCRIVSRERNGMAGPVRAKHIIDFLESVQKVAPSETEAFLMLTNMIEYDDCSEDPVVPAQVFKKEIVARFHLLNESSMAAKREGEPGL